MNSWHDRAFTSPGDTKWHFEHSLNTSLGLWTIAEHELRRNILKNSLEQNRFWDFFFSSLSIFISSLRKIDEVIVEPSSPATVYYTQHLRLGYRDYVQSITTKRGIHVMFYDTWWSFNIYTFRNTLFFLFRYMYMFFGWHKPLGSADVILCRESTVFFLLEFGDNTGVNINNKTNDISSIIGVHMKIHLFTHKLQI